MILIKWEVLLSLLTMSLLILQKRLVQRPKSFQLGFVAMTEAIVVAIRLVSYVVIIIIMLVMANTMIMTARERVWEYATLRSIGFGKFF